MIVHVFAAFVETIVTELFILVAFSTRLFAVLRFESVIHEFDP